MKMYPDLYFSDPYSLKLTPKSRQALIELYKTHTIPELAQIYGIAPSTMWKILKANNIPTRPKGQAPNKPCVLKAIKKK